MPPSLTLLASLHAAQKAGMGVRLGPRRFLTDEATERHTPIPASAGAAVCWRFVSHRHHVNPDDDAARAWMRGDRTEATTLLIGHHLTHEARYRAYQELPLTIRTLWAPGPELTEAERYRLRDLRVQAKAGFEVRVLPDSDPMPDLIMYPHRGLLYLPHYSTDGLLEGATRIRHPRLVTAFARHLTDLAEDAVDIHIHRFESEEIL